jgi:nitrogen fixation NifU-like protein
MIETPRDLYDGVILDHSKEPRNFGKLAHPTHQADGRNPICGDEISIFLQTEGEAFSAFAFSGQGCAISKASASLMTEDLRNRPPEQARERANEILQVLGQDMEGDPFERYGDLGALTAVRRYPARLKCATLAWHTFLTALAGETTASTEDS